MAGFSPLEISLITLQWQNLEGNETQLTVLARSVVEGNFKEALTSSIATELLSFDPGSSLQEPLKHSFPFKLSNSLSAQEYELACLTVAVGCLHAFAQENWTGPDLGVSPSDLISTHLGSDLITEDELNGKAISELSLGGEPAYHLMKVALLFRLSQILLDLPFDHTPSAAWWKRRVALVHQHLLDDAVSLPGSQLPIVEGILPLASHAPDLAGRLVLEEGLLYHHLGQDKAAHDSFMKAADLMGLKYELTGALGKRTKFQEHSLSQLVLLAESRERDDHVNKLGSTSVARDDGADRQEGRARVPETLTLNDDTLLEQTEYSAEALHGTESRLSHLNPSDQPALHPLDQCVLLAMCLNVRNTSPTHGLTSEQMMPYVSRVISHPKNWSVHTMALLLRSRLEAGRTRTVERATLQLQQLVEQMPTNDSTVKERLLYFHSLPIPSKWELEKELALRYMSLGVVRSALEIFERLEMWEEAVNCWQSMERPDKGISIVYDLLEGRKQESDAVVHRSKTNTTGNHRRAFDAAREAKLWCLLGDLEPHNAQDHYERAWQISGKTSGRAIRSLGGYYFARNNFAEAIPCLQRAVAINPLLTRSWFILGCACVREERWKEARDAFARCVAIDEEDGESWNNLASVYLRQEPSNQDEKDIEEGRSTQDLTSNGPSPVPFENKVLAFRALKQGLKFNYENWRMWNNYLIVAIDVGEFSEACTALGRIVEQRADKDGASCVDEEVLERLVSAATQSTSQKEDSQPNEASTGLENQALSRRVLDLFKNTILSRVNGSPRIFRAYSRLLTAQSRWTDALEAHLNAYRMGPAGSGEPITDTKQWDEAVQEVEDIVDILKNFGPRAQEQGQEPQVPSGRSEEGGESGSGVRVRSWQLQARSVLRTFLGRTKRDFEDQPEFEKLQGLLNDIRSA